MGECLAVPAAASSSQLDEERLCAELAASGLGGGECGPPSVLEEGARRWRRQSKESSDSVATSSTTASRRDVCPVLCENGLGQPLCGCKHSKKDVVSLSVSVCVILVDSDVLSMV